MIMPLISVVLLLPIIIGILSVDINGERFSVREWLALKGDTENTENFVEEQIDPTPEDEETNALIEFPQETESMVDDLSEQIGTGISFLLYQSRDFGIWVGMSTAPFHYVIAVLIGFAFFPYWWMFIGAVFYLTVRERKGIAKEIFSNRMSRKKMEKV